MAFGDIFNHFISPSERGEPSRMNMLVGQRRFIELDAVHYALENRRDFTPLASLVSVEAPADPRHGIQAELGKSAVMTESDDAIIDLQEEAADDGQYIDALQARADVDDIFKDAA